MILKKLIGLLCFDEHITIRTKDSTIKGIVSSPLYMGKLADLPFETWIKIKNLEIYNITVDNTGLDIIVYQFGV